MSKTKKLRVDFDDTAEILELILILKDIAQNLFMKSAKRKQILVDFVAYFTDFFKLASFAGVDNVVVRPKVNDTAVLAVTSESGFMGDMNSRMLKTVAVEVEKNNANEIIVIGGKAGEKAVVTYGRQKNVKVFSNIEKNGTYNMSVMAKDYIIERVIANKIGRIIAVYPFAINVNLIRPKTAILFPSTELFEKKEEKEEDVITEPILIESDIPEIMGYLASVWLTCRIYELLMNAESSGYAAQCQQLEAASDRLKKDKMFLGMALRKSRKSDISKSLSEVFAARMVGLKQ